MSELILSSKPSSSGKKRTAIHSFDCHQIMTERVKNVVVASTSIFPFLIHSLFSFQRQLSPKKCWRSSRPFREKDDPDGLIDGLEKRQRKRKWWWKQQARINDDKILDPLRSKAEPIVCSIISARGFGSKHRSSASTASTTRSPASKCHKHDK